MHNISIPPIAITAAVIRHLLGKSTTAEFLENMDGVGARLGRSSARYAPATIFTGPVRKWKKKWIHVAPSNSNQTEANGKVNGVNVSSRLLLYKWTPITPSQNKENNGNDGNPDIRDDDVTVEEPPKRKFKYIPVLISIFISS